MIRSSRNMLRLLRVSLVLARYDALFLLENVEGASAITGFAKLLASRKVKGRPGERLCKAMQKLGPTFIKLGQVISTRADLVGNEIAADLAVLRDKLPPFPASQAREIIEQELGKKVEKLFTDFNEKPVAAASIAQVHFATDKKGNEVAVKILRPGIEEKFAEDIELLSWLASLVDSSIPSMKRLKLKEVVETFANTVKTEMDLRLEAAAASELRDNFADEEGYHVPKVYWKMTSRRVMTSERVGGVKINDAKALKAAGHDTDKIMKKAAGVFFKQVFRDGFFHADMHPGNAFVDKYGNVVVVDFGIMGRIDVKTRLFLAQMLKSFLEKDYKKVAEVHFAAGYVPANQSLELFAQACRSIAEPIFGLPQNKISVGRLLGQLFKITADFNMHTQPQLLLLQKTMVMAEGIGRALNPNVNMWVVAEPLIQDWAKNNMGAEARLKIAAEESLQMVKRLADLTRAAENLSHCVTKEGVRLHPESLEKLAKKKRQRISWQWVIILLMAGSLLTFLFAGY